jgi:hypothetical protein
MAPDRALCRGSCNPDVTVSLLTDDGAVTRRARKGFGVRCAPGRRLSRRRPHRVGRERRLTSGSFVAVARHEVERLTTIVRASHLHYIVGMKTSTLPAVRVEPALRRDAEAVLDEGESLSDFVASCVRDGVAWRRTQDAFLVRASDAVERSERQDSGISAQEMLRQMDVRLETARQRLAAGKPRAGQ